MSKARHLLPLGLTGMRNRLALVTFVDVKATYQRATTTGQGVGYLFVIRCVRTLHPIQVAQAPLSLRLRAIATSTWPTRQGDTTPFRFPVFDAASLHRQVIDNTYISRFARLEHNMDVWARPLALELVGICNTSLQPHDRSDMRSSNQSVVHLARATSRVARQQETPQE